MLKKTTALLILLLSAAGIIAALDLYDGNIHLNLNERTGHFSIYLAAGDAGNEYVSFLSDKDPRTSFLQVIHNGHFYKLGNAAAFTTWLVDDPQNPALVFGSYFLRVTQEFRFIKTAGSLVTNGVAVTISVENLTPVDSVTGIRFLLDTYLGESGTVPFYLDSRALSSELMIEKGRNGRWWASRGDKISIMGSIFLPEYEGPDELVFASWKRLSDAPWRFSYVRDRSFNVLPFYVRDSAVCYYYMPQTLKGWETFSYTIILAQEDPDGYGPVPPSARNEETFNTVNVLPSDRELIQRLIAEIDALSLQNNVRDDEIALLEIELNILLRKYGLTP